MRHCVIIGSGIGGLAAAAQLAKQGYAVSVYEKNEQPGGRAGVFLEDGFRFDMGPSWYLMPEVFERFFTDLGERIEDYIELQKLSPSYRVYFEGKEQPVDIYSDMDKDAATFEGLEPGSSVKLRAYLQRSKEQYELILGSFLYARFDTVKSLLTKASLQATVKVPLLGTMQQYVSKSFKSDEVQKLLQYTLVFLGSSPYNAPAMYNIMSHIDFNQGVQYPKGGITEIIAAFVAVCKKYGVQFYYNAEVASIAVEKGMATGIALADGTYVAADIVVSNADIHFTETKLLDAPWRQYSEAYWQKRVMAPSALLMYLGVQGELPTLQHHTLYFAKDWRKNFGDIFDTPSWPNNPSYYVSNPSHTDPTVAPNGSQNVFVLVPLGAGIADTEEIRSEYSDMVLSMMADTLKIPDLKNRITYKKLFGPNDFTDRYHSFRGSALGVAHTLPQTAFGRPKSKSRKVHNLYYVGAGTHPGIGMPVCVVSAHIATDRIKKEFPC